MLQASCTRQSHGALFAIPSRFWPRNEGFPEDAIHAAVQRNVVIVGNLDGVHLGHQALIRQAIQIAKERNLKTLALTFEPHPLALLRPEAAPEIIMSQELRAVRLKESGIDEVVILPFDRPLADLSAADFVKTILCENLHTEVLIVGPNFRFGKNRAGSVTDLQALAPSANFEVKVMQAVAVAGETVSSSRIRQLIKEGKVSQAGKLLGHAHFIEGRVVTGARRGRSIGFPTANLEGIQGMLPKHGIYATWVTTEQQPARKYMGALNLGLRPTVEGGFAVEVYLLDFDGDLYQQKLRVEFIDFIRDEERFENLQALKEQIAADVDNVRERLSAQ